MHVLLSYDNSLRCAARLSIVFRDGYDMDGSRLRVEISRGRRDQFGMGGGFGGRMGGMGMGMGRGGFGGRGGGEPEMNILTEIGWEYFVFGARLKYACEAQALHMKPCGPSCVSA